eukprot:CAMPEP_0117441690 /NCGR_PEP_ID=MMETSP0759-20121206/3763_1 /TAXON_ID=63605 /ORGANISM="Percolomonas cosmopolitus, Strain WS" /LENGTH=642 /DNA_ID=CAMNT_0005233549 /DNA_START=1613 /DNA_END=3541 /DNA_ORIENTATION=-
MQQHQGASSSAGAPGPSFAPLVSFPSHMTGGIQANKALLPGQGISSNIAPGNIASQSTKPPPHITLQQQQQQKKRVPPSAISTNPIAPNATTRIAPVSPSTIVVSPLNTPPAASIVSPVLSPLICAERNLSTSPRIEEIVPLPYPLHDVLPMEILAFIASFLTIQERLTKFRVLSSYYNTIMHTQQESALDLSENSSVGIFGAMFGNVAVSGIVMDDVLIDIILDHLDAIKHQIRHVRMICLSGDNGKEYFEKSIRVLKELDHLVELSACFSSFVSRMPVLVGECFKLLSQKKTLKHLHIEGHLWWKQKIIAFPHIEILEKTELADFESLPALTTFIGDMCIPAQKWELLRRLESIHMRTANATMKSLVETLQNGAQYIKSVALHLKNATLRDRIIEVTRLMKQCEYLHSISLQSERRDDILGEEIIPQLGSLVKELNLSHHFYIEDIHACPAVHTLELSMGDIQQSDISSRKSSELTNLMCYSVRLLKLSCVQNLISTYNLLKWVHCFPNANWNDSEIGVYVLIGAKMHLQDNLAELIDFVRSVWLEEDCLHYMGLHREWINRECDILVRNAEAFWQKVQSDEITEWQHLFNLDTDQKLQIEQEAQEQFLENIQDVIYPLKYLSFEYISLTLYGNSNDFTE